MLYMHISTLRLSSTEERADQRLSLRLVLPKGFAYRHVSRNQLCLLPIPPTTFLAQRLSTFRRGGFPFHLLLVARFGPGLLYASQNVSLLSAIYRRKVNSDLIDVYRAILGHLSRLAAGVCGLERPAAFPSPY